MLGFVNQTTVSLVSSSTEASEMMLRMADDRVTWRREFVAAEEQAMRAEGVPEATIERVLQRLPTGKTRAARPKPPPVRRMVWTPEMARASADACRRMFAGPTMAEPEGWLGLG